MKIRLSDASLCRSVVLCPRRNYIARHENRERYGSFTAPLINAKHVHRNIALRCFECNPAHSRAVARKFNNWKGRI